MAENHVKVLLIQDQPDVYYHLKLSGSGAFITHYEFTPVDQLSEEAQILSQDSYDLVLVNLDGSGNPELEQLHGMLHKIHKVPVVFMTPIPAGIPEALDVSDKHRHPFFRNIDTKIGDPPIFSARL